MKKYLLSFVLLLLSVTPLFAYTKEEISKHNLENDCWVIFEDKVYDISKYIRSHERFVDIREYCGTDITQSFKDKGGEGRDHNPNSYRLLETFGIGDAQKEASYKLLLPILLVTALYWGLNYISKKGYIKGFTILKFNALFTTLMGIFFLVPTFGFGIFLILRYEITSLYDLEFDFLFWHAQLALIMGTFAMNHFIQRSSIYWKQLKS